MNRLSTILFQLTASQPAIPTKNGRHDRAEDWSNAHCTITYFSDIMRHWHQIKVPRRAVTIQATNRRLVLRLVQVPRAGDA